MVFYSVINLHSEWMIEQFIKRFIKTDYKAVVIVSRQFLSTAWAKHYFSHAYVCYKVTALYFLYLYPVKHPL